MRLVRHSLCSEYLLSFVHKYLSDENKQAEPKGGQASRSLELEHALAPIQILGLVLEEICHEHVELRLIQLAHELKPTNHVMLSLPGVQCMIPRNKNCAGDTVSRKRC